MTGFIFKPMNNDNRPEIGVHFRIPRIMSNHIDPELLSFPLPAAIANCPDKFLVPHIEVINKADTVGRIKWNPTCFAKYNGSKFFKSAERLSRTRRQEWIDDNKTHARTGLLVSRPYY